MEQAIWHLPFAALNQLLIYDDLTNGRKPRWYDSGESGAMDLDAMLSEAMTSAV